MHLSVKNAAIPKLIIRDAMGNDLLIWGPRPKVAQELVNELKASQVDYDTLNTQLQNWYNTHKGKEVQRELRQLFKELPLHQDVGIVL